MHSTLHSSIVYTENKSTGSHNASINDHADDIKYQQQPWILSPYKAHARLIFITLFTFYKICNSQLIDLITFFPITLKLNRTSTNITQLFRPYQAIIRSMILKYQTLPIESYIHELAAHTHTIVLCKNHQSHIAERVFSKSLLADLTSDLASEVIDLDQQYNLLVQVCHACRRSEPFPLSNKN
ncbi:unnamed protein product [Rhizopus microsporus]